MDEFAPFQLGYFRRESLHIMERLTCSFTFTLTMEHIRHETDSQQKGFDSQSGGCPSPIFPNGTLYSLPIPYKPSEITYGDLWHGDTHIGEVVEDLTRKCVKRDRDAHLDPDINPVAYQRQARLATLVWSIGRGPRSSRQPKGRQSGDLFLFFGLFQKIEKTSGRWCFVKECP